MTTMRFTSWRRFAVAFSTLLATAGGLAAQTKDTTITPRVVRDSALDSARVPVFRDSTFFRFTVDTVADTVIVDRPPPVIASGGCPSSLQPAGYATLTDQPFDAMPPINVGGTAAPDAYGWRVRPGGAWRVSAGGGALTGRFMANDTLNGTAPFSVFVGWSRPVVSHYTCVTLRSSAPWQMSPRIAGNKFFFFRYASSCNNGYVNWSLNIAVHSQHGCVANTNQNGPNAFPVALLGDGQPHRLEVLVQGNPLGDSTGVVQVYLDGVRREFWQGVQFYARSGIKGIVGEAFEPTHGGCGKDWDGDGLIGPCVNLVQQDIILYHWYVSGK